MTLKSPVVIFQASEPLQPQWPQQPQQPQWPQWPQQPHFIKNIADPDGWITHGTKMTNNDPFLWNGASKIQFFTNIWYPFCRRLLRPANTTFWKLVDETQMGNPSDHAARDIISKFSIFLPPRAIYFRSYHYETPCMMDNLCDLKDSSE